MTDPLPEKSRSRADSVLGIAAATIFFSWILTIVIPPLVRFLNTADAALWTGELVEIACEKISSSTINCKLTYQGVLRSSEKELKKIEEMSVRVLASGNDRAPQYFAILHTKDGAYHRFRLYSNRFQLYSRSDDPRLVAELEKLESLSHSINNFIQYPEEKLVIPFQYNRWQPILDFTSSILLVALFILTLYILSFILLTLMISLLVFIVIIIAVFIWSINSVMKYFSIGWNKFSKKLEVSELINNKLLNPRFILWRFLNGNSISTSYISNWSSSAFNDGCIDGIRRICFLVGAPVDIALEWGCDRSRRDRGLVCAN